MARSAFIGNAFDVRNGPKDWDAGFIEGSAVEAGQAALDPAKVSVHFHLCVSPDPEIPSFPVQRLDVNFGAIEFNGALPGIVERKAIPEVSCPALQVTQFERVGPPDSGPALTVGVGRPSSRCRVTVRLWDNAEILGSVVR